MADMTTEVGRAKANGDRLVAGWKGGVRSLETPNLELGDTWTFPDKYDVYQSETFGQYIFITLEGGAIKRFFPSTFTKSRAVYEADDKGMPKPLMENGKQKRMNTEGEVAIAFRGFGEISAAMDSLKGRKVKVTNVTTVKTLDFNNPGRLRNTEFLTIDFV